MRMYPFFCSLLIFVQAYSSLFDHLKPCENKPPQTSQIRHIDFIYVINLDKRPERWEHAQQQLNPYGIFPYRFSAVYGWDLPAEALNDIGITYAEGMQKNFSSETAAAYYLDDLSKKEVYLNESHYGKKFVSTYFRRGAVGCFYSHLSVLKDAYDSGYEIILVLEDDLLVHKDPYIISELIEELDREFGRENWDMFYAEAGFFRGIADDPAKNSNLPLYFPSCWRPDAPKDTSYLIQYEDVSKNFRRVALKEGTRSMVINRHGMKKILDYAYNKGLFLPIDCELAFMQDLNKFTVKDPVIGCEWVFLEPSDTAEYRK